MSLRLPNTVLPFPEFKPVSIRVADGGFYMPDQDVIVAKYDVLGEVVCAKMIVSRKIVKQMVERMPEYGQRSIESMLIREWRALLRYRPAFPFPSELLQATEAGQ